jgi:site-specific DNA-cytosine methylase
MRLQGFPDSFQPHATDRIAYEHAGNAVNAKIIREIADNLLVHLR